MPSHQPTAEEHPGVDPAYRCPECGDAGELRGVWADDRTHFYVCAVCSGAFSKPEVEPEDG